MSTLQELIDLNPNTLLDLTKDGSVSEKMNYINGATVHMDSGNQYDITSSGWALTRENIYSRKEKMIVIVDALTQAIINRGFSHDGEYFSLSGNAQSNWNALVTRLLCGKLTFPFPVTTIDDGTYTIQTLDSFNTFIDSAVYVVAYNLAVGRYLKGYIKAATTHEQLDAFVDSRT